MPFSNEDTNKTEVEQLMEDINSDIQDRSEWSDQFDQGNRMRLGERRRNPLYRGAPNFLDPIIDDNCNSLTAQQNNIVWAASTLALFIPLSQEAFKVKQKIEQAFDTLLRLTLNVRRKISMLLDTHNESGIANAVIVENSDIYPRIFGIEATVPDFAYEDPRNIVVPINTEHIQLADRITHIKRYTKREFEEEARKRNWENVEKVKEKNN